MQEPCGIHDLPERKTQEEQYFEIWAARSGSCSGSTSACRGRDSKTRSAPGDLPIKARGSRKAIREFREIIP